MRWPVIVVPFMKVNGMALFPFILVQRRAMITDKVLINHEQIHIRQQAEMLVLPFYVFYLVNYLANRLKRKSHYAAYINIVFEREAYANETNMHYLNNRKYYSWLRYFKAA